MNVSANGPMQYSDVPVPKIIDAVNGYWKPRKEFKIPQRYQEDMDKAIKSKDFTKVWEIADKSFKSKPLPKGDKSKIEKIAGFYFVIIEEPYKTELE